MAASHRLAAPVLIAAALTALLADPGVAAVRPGIPQAAVEQAPKVEAAPASLEQLYDALRTPVITGVIPTPATLKAGRAEIHPGPGARLLVMSAGGRACGWLLDGPATMTYRVEDRYSVPVARRNAKAAGGLELGMDGGVLWIRVNVQGIAAWTWEVDAGAAAPVRAGEAMVPAWLRDFIDRKPMAQPEVDMLLAARNGETALAWVVLHRSDDLALRVDPSPSQRIETLYRMREASAEEVAAQPISRTWLNVPRLPLVSIDTEADVSNPAGQTLRVSARTRVQLQRNAMTVLPMLLWDEVRVGEQVHPYRVTKLTVDGAAVGWLQRKGYLLVDLPRPVQRGESITLDLVAEVDLLSSKPPEYYHWRLVGAWYPTPGPFGRELAQIRLSATLKDPFVPLAGGDVQERSSVDGVNSVRTRLAGPMESGIVVGGRYSAVLEEQSGTHVYVSALEKQHEAKALNENVTSLATTAIAVRQCLERWLEVPYPFPDLQMIETGFELDQVPGVIFLNYGDIEPVRRRLSPGNVLEMPLSTRQWNHRIAREVAHGWFPHVAKVTSREESWLGESLAGYAGAYCLSEVEADRKEGARLFKLTVDDWKTASTNAGDDASVLLAEHLGGSNTVVRLATLSDTQYSGGSIASMRSLLLQGRGPLVRHGVRERLLARYGEERGTNMFLVWIRYYVKNFTYKPASTRALVAILEKVTGETWQAYFEQYLLGTDPSPVK